MRGNQVMAEATIKKPASFIEEARRKQIVESALRTIAEKGYSRTSFAEIAKELGITKGLIAYHFEGKQDLFLSIIDAIIDGQARHIALRLQGREGAVAMLRAYIEASFEYIVENRAKAVALVDLWGSFTSAEEKRAFNARAYGPCSNILRGIFEQGQQNEEFREFNPRTMTHVLQGAIDGVMLQFVFNPDGIDMDDCSRGTLELIMGAVRRH